MAMEREGRSREEWLELFRRKEKDPELMKVFHALVKESQKRIEEMKKGDRIDPEILNWRVTI